MEGKDPTSGKFVTGNRWWEARSSHGTKPTFEAADDLLDAVCQYFEWNANNPLYEAKPFAYEGVVTVEPVEKMRAATIVGLCMFIGITQRTWSRWRAENADFRPVIEWAEDAIYRNKFEGAAAGLLNANIISRDLGLADKQEHTSPDGSMSPAPDLSHLSVEEREEIKNKLYGPRASESD